MIDVFLSEDLMIAACDDNNQRFFQVGECVVAPYGTWKGAKGSSPFDIAYNLAGQDVYALVFGQDERVPKVVVADRSIVVDVRSLDGEMKQLTSRPDFYIVHDHGFPEVSSCQYVFARRSAKVLAAPELTWTDVPSYYRRRRAELNNKFYDVWRSFIDRCDDEFREQKLECIVDAYLSADVSVVERFQHGRLLESTVFHSLFDQHAARVRKIVVSQAPLPPPQRLDFPTSIVAAYRALCVSADSALDVSECAQKACAANSGYWFENEEIAGLVEHIGSCTRSSWWKRLTGRTVFPVDSVLQVGQAVSDLVSYASARRLPMHRLFSVVDQVQHEVPPYWGAFARRLADCLKK